MAPPAASVRLPDASPCPPPPALSGGRPRFEPRKLAVVAGISALAGAAIFFKVPLCPFAHMTGHPCPGCGLTRATLAVLRGDLGTAFHLQPFAFIVSPIAAVALAITTHQYFFGPRPGLPPAAGRLFNRVGLPVVIAMSVFWVARFFGFWGGPVPV